MRTCLALLSALIACNGSLSAQQQDQQTPAFRAGVDVVSLNVTASDLDGRFVTDLDQTNFQIYEDGVQQNVTFFTKTQLPIALAMLNDTSASMDEKMAVCLKKISPALDEFYMFRPHCLGMSNSFVRVECLFSTTLEPIIRLGAALQKTDHHLFMIPQDRYDAALFFQANKFRNHLPTSWSVIHTIPKKNECILLGRLNFRKQGPERPHTPMNVAKSNDAFMHKKSATSGALERRLLATPSIAGHGSLNFLTSCGFPATRLIIPHRRTSRNATKRWRSLR